MESTVARFIQRFREDRPVSPRQRRLYRPELDEQFWWTRSNQEIDFGTESEDLISGSIANGIVDEVAQGEGSGRQREGSDQSVSELEGLYDPKMTVLGMLETNQDNRELERMQRRWEFEESPLSSPLSSGPPDPPTADEDLHEEPKAGVGRQLLVESTHESKFSLLGEDRSAISITQGDESARMEADTITDLDVRATNLLERCRQLLAEPSIAEQPSTSVTPSAIGCYGGESRVATGATNSFPHSFPEAAEQKTRMMLHDTESAGCHPSPNSARHMKNNTGATTCGFEKHQEKDLSWVRTQMLYEGADVGYGSAGTLLLQRRTSGDVASEDGKGNFVAHTYHCPNFPLRRRGMTNPPHELERLNVRHGVSLEIGLPCKDPCEKHCHKCSSYDCHCRNESAITLRSVLLSASTAPASLPHVSGGFTGEWLQSAEEFAQDPVVRGLVNRAQQIQSEHRRRQGWHL